MTLEKSTKKIPLARLVALVVANLGIPDPARISDAEVQAIAELLEAGDNGPKATADLVRLWLAGELPEAGFIPRLAELAGIEIDSVETPAPPATNPAQHPLDPKTLDERLMALVSTDGTVDQTKLTKTAHEIGQRAGVGSLRTEAVLRWCNGDPLPSRYSTTVLQMLETTLGEVNFAQAMRIARKRMAEDGSALAPDIEACSSFQDWADVARRVAPAMLRYTDISRICRNTFGISVTGKSISSAIPSRVEADTQVPSPETFSGVILSVHLFLADPRQALVACAWNEHGALDPPARPTHAALSALMHGDRRFSPEALRRSLADTLCRQTLDDLLAPKSANIVPNPATLARALQAHPPLCVALFGKNPDGSTPDGGLPPPDEAGPAPGEPAPTGAQSADERIGSTVAVEQPRPSEKNKPLADPALTSFVAGWKELSASDPRRYAAKNLSQATGLAGSTLRSLFAGWKAFTPMTLNALTRAIPELWEKLPEDHRRRVLAFRASQPHTGLPALDIGAEPGAENAKPTPENDIARPHGDPAMDDASAPPTTSTETPIPEAVAGERLVLAEAGPNEASDNGRTLPSPPPSVEIEAAASAHTSGTAPPTRTLPVPAEPPQVPAKPKDAAPAEPQRLHPDDIEAIAERVATKATPLNPEQILALVAAYLDLPPIDHPFIDGSQLLHQNVVEALRHVRELAASLKRAGAPVDNRVRAAVVNALAPLMKVYGLTPEMLAQAYETKSLTADELAAHMASRKS